MNFNWCDFCTAEIDLDNDYYIRLETTEIVCEECCEQILNKYGDSLARCPSSLEVIELVTKDSE